MKKEKNVGDQYRTEICHTLKPKLNYHINTMTLTRAHLVDQSKPRVIQSPRNLIHHSSIIAKRRITRTRIVSHMRR